MKSARLEAFSDGVIAILITIMVLGLATPSGTDWNALQHRIPLFLVYVLSFVFLGIYWNNHHHLFAAVETVDGVTLWANLHLLLWLSLIPFATRWLGEQGLEPLPAAFYGFVGLLCAVAYYILLRVILAAQGPSSLLAEAVGRDIKGKVSPVAYAVAIPAAWLSPWISIALYVFVAALWFVPDRRIERRIGNDRARTVATGETGPEDVVPIARRD